MLKISKENKEELIDSIIGSGNSFKGEFRLNGALRVDGTIDGDITTNSRLHISKLGKGRGIIRANSIEIGGEFQGELLAKHNIIIKSTASVKGNIKASLLLVEEGAYYSGRCNINPNNLNTYIREIEENKNNTYAEKETKELISKN